MRTVSFDQAQSAYENMSPEEYGDADYQDQFDNAFVVGAGQLVMTPDGTGILTGGHEGETLQEWDDGYYSESNLTTVEVSVPSVGKTFYNFNDIEIRKNSEWVTV
jgi:hypothetical protein